MTARDGHYIVSFGTAGSPASRCVHCHRTWATLPSMVRDTSPAGPPCPCDACRTEGAASQPAAPSPDIETLVDEFMHGAAHSSRCGYAYASESSDGPPPVTLCDCWASRNKAALSRALASRVAELEAALDDAYDQLEEEGHRTGSRWWRQPAGSGEKIGTDPFPAEKKPADSVAAESAEGPEITKQSR